MRTSSMAITDGGCGTEARKSRCLVRYGRPIAKAATIRTSAPTRAPRTGHLRIEPLDENAHRSQLQERQPAEHDASEHPRHTPRQPRDSKCDAEPVDRDER